MIHGVYRVKRVLSDTESIPHRAAEKSSNEMYAALKNGSQGLFSIWVVDGRPCVWCSRDRVAYKNGGDRGIGHPASGKRGCDESVRLVLADVRQAINGLDDRSGPLTDDAIFRNE